MKRLNKDTMKQRASFMVRLNAILLGISLATTGFAGTITVNITGVAGNEGFLRVILFSKDVGFPSNYKHGIRDTSIAKPDGSETVTFANIPAGTYAVSILHDRNGNKTMDTGMFGIPKEPYGVSNNIHPKTREPRFEECDFVIKHADSKTLIIKMKQP